MRRNEQLTFTKVCKRIKKKNYDTKQFPEDIKLLLEIAGCFFAGGLQSLPGPRQA